VGDKDGAPHNVDEVAAIVLGGEKPECSLATLANKRAVAFGTASGCNSQVNTAMVKALNDARAAARKGDMQAFLAARSKIKSLMSVVFVQVCWSLGFCPHNLKATAAKACCRFVQPCHASSSAT